MFPRGGGGGAPADPDTVTAAGTLTADAVLLGDGAKAIKASANWSETASGQLLAPAGSAALPALAIVQANLGLYQHGTDLIGIATAGANRVQIHNNRTRFAHDVWGVADLASSLGSATVRWGSGFFGTLRVGVAVHTTSQTLDASTTVHVFDGTSLTSTFPAGVAGALYLLRNDNATALSVLTTGADTTEVAVIAQTESFLFAFDGVNATWLAFQFA